MWLIRAEFRLKERSRVVAKRSIVVGKMHYPYVLALFGSGMLTLEADEV